MPESDTNGPSPGGEGPPQRIAFLGCPLDCDEREPSINEKMELLEKGVEEDPYERVLALALSRLEGDLTRCIGSLDVPAWLRPIPKGIQRGSLRVEEFVKFIDRGDCRKWAEKAAMAVRGILPDIPCLIGIDHSLAGGAIQELARMYAPENMSVVVLDSHTDAISTKVMGGLLAFDMETNPHSLHDPEDPYLKNRPESYNAGTFLLFLLDEGSVLPENLYLLGAGDTPPKRASRVKDSRVEKYVEAYATLRRRGVKTLTKEDLIKNPSKVKAVLGDITTPYLYLSVDMDVGAGNALRGVRFKERIGLNERQIMGVTEHIAHLLKGNIRLAGIDLSEFNPRYHQLSEQPCMDRTYIIAANIIETIARCALKT